MERQTTRQRNEIIKKEYQSMIDQHLQKGYIYNMLAEKYFVQAQTIAKVVKGQTIEEDNDSIVFEITLKRK